ncbi:hypothetical protein DOY81_010001 [Sarcophaga bullata]|nr:hypothetical protein DOY81_010001 [Sarcophaga bullata]
MSAPLAYDATYLKSISGILKICCMFAGQSLSAVAAFCISRLLFYTFDGYMGYRSYRLCDARQQTQPQPLEIRTCAKCDYQE